MLKVMHICMEHVHLLWHLMAFYIRNLAAKGLMQWREHIVEASGACIIKDNCRDNS